MLSQVVPLHNRAIYRTRFRLTYASGSLIVRVSNWVTWLGDKLIRYNSIQTVGGILTLALALDRYKQGMCPCCGKGRGETKGLEYRTRSNDLYCHTCKRRWPVELELAYLQRELQISLQSVPDSHLNQDFDLDPQCKRPGVETKNSGFRRLVRRIVWWRS